MASHEVEILNDESSLARIAASAAFIHNAAALKASDSGPITATQIINFIPKTIRQFI
jgi:NAD(P)H-hydrate repair Nnr-like enzyme with NAD(P)H-hydrate dehydratase domain